MKAIIQTGPKTLLLGIATCLLGMSFAFSPNGWVQLLLMVLVLASLVTGVVNLLHIPHRWCTKGKLSIGPFGISILFALLLVLSVFFGLRARIMKFRFDIPKYEYVISMMKKGEIRVDQDLQTVDLTSRFAYLGDTTLAEEDENGVLTVEFLIGGGFPEKHSGWLYREDDNPMAWKNISRWPRIEKIDPRWYRIGD